MKLAKRGKAARDAEKSDRNTLVMPRGPGDGEHRPLSRWGRLGAFAFLAAMTILSYAGSFQNGFCFDDRVVILKNERIRHLDQIPSLFLRGYWESARDSNDSTDVRNTGDVYRPVVLTTFSLNYAFGGYETFGYHLVNLVLHICVTWLALDLALMWGLSPGGGLLASTLFAVHPLHTEAVTGVVGRAELLMSMGVLLALRFYRSSRTSDRGRGPLVLSLVWFVFALLSKEQAVALPILLVLADLSFQGRGMEKGRAKSALGGALWRCIPYFVAIAGFLVLRAAIVGTAAAALKVAALENPLASADTMTRVLTAIKIGGMYLWLFFWPVRLSADYSFSSIPLSHSLDFETLTSIIVWSGLLALGVFSFVRRKPIPLLAVSLLVFPFLPVSNILIPIGTIMGERLFYLPSLGLCILVGALVDFSREWLPTGRNRRLAGTAGAAILAAWGIALSARTISRNRDWVDMGTLMQSVVRNFPENAKAHYILGLFRQERGEEALHEFEEAMRIFPRYPTHIADFSGALGSALVRVGRTSEAVPYLEWACKKRPTMKEGFYNLGYAEGLLGKWEDAERNFLRALEIDPADTDTRVNLCWVYRETGRMEESLAMAEKTIRLNPGQAQPHVDRGRALEAVGRAVEALSEYELALRLSPGLAAASRRAERLRARSAFSGKRGAGIPSR